jgi:hypothetical protein
MTLIGGQEQDDSCVNALEKGKAMGQGRGGKGVWRKGEARVNKTTGTERDGGMARIGEKGTSRARVNPKVGHRRPLGMIRENRCSRGTGTDVVSKATRRSSAQMRGRGLRGNASHAGRRGISQDCAPREGKGGE